jgi:hypothetical protein
MGSSGSGHGQMVGCSEHVNELLVSMKGGNSLTS